MSIGHLLLVLLMGIPYLIISYFAIRDMKRSNWEWNSYEDNSVIWIIFNIILSIIGIGIMIYNYWETPLNTIL